MAFGITPTGFAVKTVQDLLAEIQAEQRSLIDPNIDVGSETLLGQINGIVAGKLGEAWEILEGVYNQGNVDDAEDDLLSSLCLLTGTERRQATKGRVEMSLTVGGITTVPVGHIVAQFGNVANRWLLLAEIVTTGAGVYTGIYEAESTGVVEAAAGTLTVIVNPVAQLTSVTNALDADPGLALETDTALKLRREAELRALGAGTAPAIKADILDSDPEDIISVTVLVNDQDFTDSNGVPPHAINPIIWDGDPPSGDDDAIAQAIHDSKAAGIQTSGSDSGTATDLDGVDHIINFSRPTLREVWLEVDVTINALTFPVDGDAQIEAAIVSVGNALLVPGQDVILLPLRAEALKILGVLDAPAMRAGFAAAPTGTVNLAVGVRQIARLDTSRIVVTHV